MSCLRLIPVLTGNSNAALAEDNISAVNPRAYGEQYFDMLSVEYDDG